MTRYSSRKLGYVDDCSPESPPLCIVCSSYFRFVSFEYDFEFNNVLNRAHPVTRSKDTKKVRASASVLNPQPKAGLHLEAAAEEAAAEAAAAAASLIRSHYGRLAFNSIVVQSLGHTTSASNSDTSLLFKFALSRGRRRASAANVVCFKIDLAFRRHIRALA